MARHRARRPPARPVSAVEVARPRVGVTYPMLLVPDGVDPTVRPVRVTGLASVLVALGVFVVVTPLVNTVLQSLFWTGLGREGTLTEFVRSGQRYEHVWGLLGSHLGFGAVVAVLLLVMRVLHRRDAAWLWSVSDGVRWRYLLAAWLLALPVFTVGSVAAGVPRLAPQPGYVGWLVAIVLVTPLQALAEEVVFRGYLVQALGMAVPSEAFAVVMSALVFAAFHGTQNWWLFASRLAFGLLAGLLVLRTGGLEAAVAAHVVNNVLAFGLAALTSSVAEVRAVQQIGWTETVRDVAVYGAFTGLALLAAARMRVPVRTAADPV